MSSAMVTAVTGGAAGVVAAIPELPVSLSSRRKTQAETLKLRVETDKIRLETAEIDSRAANAESMARLAYQTSANRQSITLYDSRSDGFSLFDFEIALWEPAAGGIRLASSQEGGVRAVFLLIPLIKREI